MLLGLGTAYLMIAISKTVIPGKAAYLPAALFLVVPFRSHLDATHHWFSTLFAMAALAVVIQRITAMRLVVAGALCGVAMCFTQSTGLPALLALGLFFSGRQQHARWPGSISAGHSSTCGQHLPS